MDPALSVPKQLRGPQNSQMMRQAARREGAPVGSPRNNEWVDAVNSSSNQQLDSFFEKTTIPYYRGLFSTDRNVTTSSPVSTYQASPAVRSNQERYRTGAAQSTGGVRQPQASSAGQQVMMPNLQQPRYSPAWQQQYEQTFNQAMANDRDQTIRDTDRRIDSRLAASRGDYPTPENRRAGFFGRGFNMSMPEPQPERQMMFDPVQNAAANRALFAQHTNSMQNNPAYAQRVNAERAARRDQLADRDAIANARRQGAIEAAGSSQQLRNLMAGRGALGAGRDGFGALMSMAAMRNPNEAFGDFGPAFMGLSAPGMQTERLGAEGRMLDRNLGAQERMLGQNLGAQERMLGQNLGSNERIAALQQQALSAEQDAQRAFLASQNALDFRQKKELEDIAYTRRKESERKQAQLQIALGAQDPMQARQMLQIYEDPTAALDPSRNPGVDVPRFTPSPEASGNRRQMFSEFLDWAARNNLDERNPFYQNEIRRLQVSPLPDEAQRWQREIDWSNWSPFQYNYMPWADSYEQQERNQRVADFLRRMAGQQAQGNQAPAMAPLAPSQSQFNSYDTVY